MPYAEESNKAREYIIGIDLGQMSDYAALALLESHYTGATADKPEFDVTYLHRWPIGTPYPKIAAGVATMLDAEPFRRVVNHGLRGTETLHAPVTLAIDATGVGRPVVDMFTERGLPGNLLPITITGGHVARFDNGGCLVPKRILVSTLQVALQNKRLRIAAKLPEASTLTRELQDFQLTFTENANDTYEGRKGAHDDLVLAVALCLWAGTHAITRITDEERKTWHDALTNEMWY